MSLPHTRRPQPPRMRWGPGTAKGRSLTAPRALFQGTGKRGLSSSANTRAPLDVEAKGDLHNKGAKFDPQRSREAGCLGSWHPKEAAGSPQGRRTPEAPQAGADLRPRLDSWSPRRGR